MSEQSLSFQCLKLRASLTRILPSEVFIVTTNNRLLDQISIPSPCPEDWDAMTGDELKRHCQRCNKPVYDVSRLTATEAMALIETLQGSLCARLTWKADGTLLTETPLPALSHSPRRTSPLAAAAVTTLIAITPNAAARHVGQATSVVQTEKESRARAPESKAQSGEATASIAGTILDQAGAVIAGAKVSLTADGSAETREVTSSENGEYQFSGLNEGAFTLTVQYPGFMRSITNNVLASPRQEQRVDVTMRVGQTSGGVIAIMPKPLRVLYNESDLVVVARAGVSKTVENQRDAHLVKTTLLVSSILKGSNNGKPIDVYHWSYGDLESPLGGGDGIFFLKQSQLESRGKPRGGYVIDDTMYGLKKLAGGDLKSYLDRIAELSQISVEHGPVNAAITEWLVRCVEDPVTRWEGAYELIRSGGSDSDEADRDKPAESNDQPSEAADGRTSDEVKSESQPDFAALLTVEQRMRLMNALFTTEQIQNRDFELIELAQRFKEPRLAPFLIEQLRRLEANPPRFAARLIDAVMSALEDKSIAALAEEYQDNATYLDQNNDETESKSAETASPEAVAAIKDRSKLLGDFIRAAEAALAQKQTKSAIQAQR
jgi:hypothetical protein